MVIGADRTNLFVDPPILMEEGLLVLGVGALAPLFKRP